MSSQISTARRTIIFGIAAISLFLAALDQTIVATTLPKILKDLGGQHLLSWVFAAYLLAEIPAGPLIGKFSDRWGRKKLALFSVFLFLLGSALVGQSSAMIQLIFFRGIQGIGGGGMLVIATALVGDIFAPAQRARWQGLLAGVFVIAMAVGPLAGGFIADTLSWRWNFYLNIPIGLLLAVALARALPKDSRRTAATPDINGAATLTLALVSLTLGLIWPGTRYPWSSPITIGLFAAAACFFALFLFCERQAKDPVLRIEFLRNRVFLAATTISFFISAALFGAIIYIPLFVQQVLGKTATNSGLILLPLALSLFFTSILIGQILAHLRRYRIITIFGVAITAIGMALFSRISPSVGEPMMIRNMVIVGIGLGFIFPVLIVALQNAFPRKDFGVVSAANHLARTLGGLVGLAVLGSVFNNSLAHGVSSAIQNVFSVSIFFLVIAFVAAVFFKEVPLRTNFHEDEGDK